MHADNHTFAFHPTHNQTLYAGNDGGFFVSRDGGSTWDDSPNEGLCLMQYEAIDNHGTSDALVQGGTQDNGTQQYRNSPVHYHSADGDGGYCSVSKVNGNNVTHAYYENSIERSTEGGRFGSYTGVTSGLNGGGLFYPPSAISPTSERIAWATNVVNIDDAMGTGGWPGSGVDLPGINGRVSAVTFANDSLVYCASTSGQVYRLDRARGTWTARALHAAPLPTGQWIWDVESLPGDDDTVLVAFSGFGLSSHVWPGPSRGPAQPPGRPSARGSPTCRCTRCHWRPQPGGTSGPTSGSSGRPTAAATGPTSRRACRTRRCTTCGSGPEATCSVPRPTVAGCGRSGPTWTRSRSSTCSSGTT